LGDDALLMRRLGFILTEAAAAVDAFVDSGSACS
jgi:hypothetical protein